MTETNYDETLVPAFTLPDPLVSADRTLINTPDLWINKRRPEIMGLFEHHVYGKIPGKPPEMTFEVTSEEPAALRGTATRRQVTGRLSNQTGAPAIHILLYLPNHALKQAVPAFLALNFRGNHSIHHDPGIQIVPQWVQNPETGDVSYHQPQVNERGSSASRWPIDDILARGYALVTAHYEDLDPDYYDNFQNGVHGFCHRDDRSGNAWGAISAWAWGLSRIMDYIETDTAIDNTRVTVMGHSRLGKTALWAGANDPRFAAVISNESGCGGAALSRRQFGETVETINTRFPHWFCTNFKAYNAHVDALPVDQHELITLIAPRPVYIASAVEDRWADPYGEFLAGKYAHPVYTLLGTEGLPTSTHPPLNQPVVGQIGYHIRPGIHNVTPYDWEQFMNFTDKHLTRG